MIRNFVINCLLIFTIKSNAVNSQGINWTEIDTLAENFLIINETPGLGLSIINSTSGETFAKGYGLRDKEEGISMQNDTRFLIASISKSFTAVTISRVLSEKFPELGQSVLDIPIVELVPTFNLTLVDRYRTKHATFRDLLSHRMCLNSYGIGVTAGAYASRADRLYRYRYIPEQCGFRSRFEYSNAMIILAGEITSHIVGVPFENLVANLLQEIGMDDSLIVTPTEDYETLEKMSRGYYRNLDGQLTKMNASVYNSHSGAASGGVISTAADMAKYILFHLNKGQAGGVQIVPEEIMEWLYEPSNLQKYTGHKSNSESKGSVSGNYAYGLGLDIGLYEGWLRVSHDGDLSPFTARLAFYPDLGLGIFSGINGPGPLPVESDHVQLHNDITKSLLVQAKNLSGEKNYSPRVQKSNSVSIQFQNLRAKIDPSDLIGVYGHPYEADINILYNGTTLSLQYGIWGKGQLIESEVDNIYTIQWEGDIISIFLAYSGGPPLPDIKFDFNKPETLIYIDADGSISYLKDGTLETYPEIPWDEGSCL